jgi:type II secretory pathway component PulM
MWMTWNDPTIEDPRVERREGAVQAEADNVSMADLLDYIAGDNEAQGFLEALLQEIRNDARTSADKLSRFLDRQAMDRAERRVKEAA